MILGRLLLRRHRLLVIAWSALLVGLAGGTLPSYQSTYRTAEQRRVAVELARHDAASTLLYGRIAVPGTPAQLFVWEAGAIVTVLAAVLAVLLAVAVTRAAEEDGTLELVRTCGLDPRTPMRAALGVLVLVGSVIAIACAAAAGTAGQEVEGTSWPGAVAFGLVVGLTFLLTAAATAVVAQVVPGAGGARATGLLLIAGAFAVRAVADGQDLAWLGALSPLGLRATVRPFSGDRWWVLAGAAGVTAVLAAAAARLAARREFGAGLLRRRERREVHLDVRSGYGLTARLARPTVLAWAAGIVGLGTAFPLLGSGVVEQSRRGDLGGFLGAQLRSGDAVASYFSYCGTVVGLMACAFAVLGVLRARDDEVRGLTDQVLASGVRRWEPLLWRAVVTAVAGGAVLLVTAGLAALVAPWAVSGPDVAERAFAYCAGQWPATVAAAGWTALLVGLFPRATWLSWTPLAASGVLALLGRLLGVPERIRGLGVLQHVPDVASAHPDLRPLGVLLALAVAGALLGLVGTARRDVMTG